MKSILRSSMIGMHKSQIGTMKKVGASMVSVDAVNVQSVNAYMPVPDDMM
jgi:hypothetical protein